MPTEPRTLISSVQRALKIVDIVAMAERPLPVKALAQAAGLNLGTTYNLTRTLVHEGYLAVEPDGLVLGGRFPSLRRGFDDRGVFLARVRNTLRIVSAEHGATAYLARFTDGEVRVIDIVDASGSPRVELWQAMAESSHGSELGRQILAQLSREQRADYLRRHPPVPRPVPVGNRRRPVLNRRQHPPGTILGPDDQPAIACVAVPVRAPGVIAALAVSLGSVRRDLDLADLSARLRDSAALLSLQLGAEHRMLHSA